MRLVIGVVVVVWLVIGAAAAAQRGYFDSDRTVDCRSGATTAVTVVAGPLNYVGVDPKISCKAPRPS
jgi:hypothetical protein